MNATEINSNYDEDELENIWEKYFRNFSSIKDFDKHIKEENFVKNIVIIILYSLIFIVSIFGNSLVCYIIFSKRQMRTVTNCYIANLTFSDLLMTLVNIPFNTLRLLLDDWPFGQILCKCVPFIQACSVYVSTLTMCVIGLDRHQAIIYPFGKRLSDVLPIRVIIPLMWALASILSIPHAYFNEVITFLAFRPLIRCRMEFPEPQHLYRQLLTVLTFSTQYVIPLSIATISYCKIALHIHRRGIVGNITQQQLAYNLRSNRKTIKMLILVLVVFAICWLPINLYHISADFAPDSHRHNFTVFIAFHWLAMSSVCYNPFIYSVRNSYFREGVQKFFHIIICRCDQLPNNHSRRSPENYSNTRVTSMKISQFRKSSSEESNDHTFNGSIEMDESKQHEINSNDVKNPKKTRVLSQQTTDEKDITDV